MNFRIADTFTSSLSRLTNQEQKAVKTTAFDLQLDPSGVGRSFHKLDRAKDANFWSVRVNDDIRIIVHRSQDSLLLAYVDHHDDAYRWAERRKIEKHPATGAMQLVELPIERFEPVGNVMEFQLDDVSSFPASVFKPPLFGNLRKLELMSFGVPAEWVDEVRAANEDTLFEIINHLPQEAQEALLKLAVGETPVLPEAAPETADPFAHPDALRRFRQVDGADALRLALEFPWEKWAVFLHPSQQALVKRKFAGPARVSGSAGTGKTIVALHRAVHLARTYPDARILLTTFSKALANSLRAKLRVLAADDAIAGRIEVKPIATAGYELYAQRHGQPNMASEALIRSLLLSSAREVEGAEKFGVNFLFAEWSEMVDAWQIRDWESYRDASRLGRKTRLAVRQREILWQVFERVRAGLAVRKVVTWPDVFGMLTHNIAAGKSVPFNHAVVDECQDLGVAEARFLAAMAAGNRDGLFFAGDLGQRIFQLPFSWRSLGLDVRGRSATLRINYRTSHQIRSHADRLLPKAVSDVDGLTEERTGTISLFDGPAPQIAECASEAHETAQVAGWLRAQMDAGLLPVEIGVVVRSAAQLARARKALKAAGIDFVELGEKAESIGSAASLATMHHVKGLEFRAVAVMACDDEVLPLQERIESVSDESDLEEVYDTERHLLYVACTRARENLLVSGVEPMSEFLQDIIRQPR